MSDNTVDQAIREASQKVEAKVHESIREFVTSSDFAPSQGLDFLEAKNSLLLSYLIELTHDMRNRLQGESRSVSSQHRLTVMKTVLEKSRGLEKKLRYQIDKLLASGTNASSFVSADTEDPLQLRPDTSALRDDDDSKPAADDLSQESGESDDDSSTSDMDDDLAAARATVAASRSKRDVSKGGSDEDDEDDDGVYRAPRLSAVPYNLDKEDKSAEREKRKLRRMRTSELAQALRSQYGEAPEQEDIHGGTEMGRQREASRRFEEQQREKTKYEEDTMVRLTTTRKEKKERKRLLREESSNLAAIADLGNIVRDSKLAESDKKRRKPQDTGPDFDDFGADGVDSRKNRKHPKAKNSLQAALFGGDSSKKKKKSKRK